MILIARLYVLQELVELSGHFARKRPEIEGGGRIFLGVLFEK